MAAPRKKKTPPAPLGRYLRRFTLENVRTFRSPVTLDFCHADGRVAQWTVILGENGTGKTTLLQYLAGMAPQTRAGEAPRDLPPDVATIAFANRPLLSDPTWAGWHTANVPAFDKSIVLSAKLELSRGAERLSDALLDHISPNPQFMFSWTFAKSEETIRWSNIVQRAAEVSTTKGRVCIFGYGASRHVAGPASPYLTSETFFKNGGGEPSSTLYHDDYPLISPEQWLLGLHHASRSNGEVGKSARRAFESALRCLKSTLPGLHSIDVKPQSGSHGSPTMALMCRTDYGEVPFGVLSLGYRTMSAWLTDFIKRMHEAFPELNEPDDGPAIVLIDEFDLHMHPKWQREAMAALSKEFPNTQFIVTAHSPLVVQAADSERAKIVVLQRRKRDDGLEEVVIADHPRDAAGWRVDQILESFYDVPPESPRFEELTKERVRLRQKNKLAPAEKRRLAVVETELKQLTPPDEAQASKDLLADLKQALQAACGDK